MPSPPRRVTLALLALLGVAGTLGAAEARSRVAIQGRLLAPTLDGGVLPYPARRLWLVEDTPELRGALRRACAGWMAAMTSGARERDGLLRRRMATLDSALRPVRLGDADGETRRYEMMRRSEAIGDSLVALMVRARGTARLYSPDAVATAHAAAMLHTDLEGGYVFPAVRRGDWFVVPESVDPVGAPARWYPVHVRGRPVTQDLAGVNGTGWCDVGR